MNNIKSVAIAIRNINTKSGLGKIVLEQIKYCTDNNIKVDIFTSKYDDVAENSGANIMKIMKFPFINEYYKRLLFSRSVTKKLNKNKYDLVIGHGDIIEQDIIFLHNLVEKTYFLTHKKVMNPLNHIAKIRRLILSKQRFKMLVANSELMKKELIKVFHIPEEKITVIYPAYNPKQFNVIDAVNQRLEARHELGVDANTLLIGFITSGDFKKRALPLFIEALHKLPKDINYKVLLVGKDKNTALYLEGAKKYNLYDKFIIKDPIESVEKYFHAVDFSVHPAYFEEFGMVVEEAMACGLPVLTSALVGASEIMLDKSLLMKEPNSDELSLFMEKLLLNPELRKYLSQSSLKSVENRTWKRYIDKSIQVIQKI